jgi:hypothetical protein
MLEGMAWSGIPVEKRAIRQALKTVGDAAWNAQQDIAAAYPGVFRNVIVACRGMLWRLQISSDSFANEHLDRVVAGDIQNSARHFTNRYGYNCRALPVKRLIGLAAHTVLVAGREFPRGVGGLDVVVIPRDGVPRFLTGEEIGALKRWSEALDAMIETQLLGEDYYDWTLHAEVPGGN